MYTDQNTLLPLYVKVMQSKSFYFMYIQLITHFQTYLSEKVVFLFLFVLFVFLFGEYKLASSAVSNAGQSKVNLS